MAVINKIRRAVRGEVSLSTVALESLRRGGVYLRSRRERSSLTTLVSQEAQLEQRFQLTFAENLLAHFKDRHHSFSAPGFSETSTSILQQRRFPEETAALIAAADRIVKDHCWPILGFGQKCFGKPIEWRRDPLSGHLWELEYHREINLFRNDGSDARVLWELNRLGHVLTLGRAYKITGDEKYSAEFFEQVADWSRENPVGLGPNWNCAMEVALRAINLLGALELFRGSSHFTPGKLQLLLSILDQHGRHIRRNLEFSYVATSNHYFTDVVGLLWLGVLLPELRESAKWRAFGLRELLREMDKQLLDDGADFESSTGYHRYIVELLLYSFTVCRAHRVNIDQKYWDKLHQMLNYTRSYLRPDGSAPLIGDSDSGQVLPIKRRQANDHEYLLHIGAVLFNDESLKAGDSIPSEELLWVLGSNAVEEFERMPSPVRTLESVAFENAGTYIMRSADLYLCFNTSGAGVNGRGSHGHNDALSVELSAHGRPFIVDPGTYIYTGDLEKRHTFRSTAYHSTVMIDRTEQNTTNVAMPFVIGDEARPEKISWESGPVVDRVSGRHYGYERLADPVTHQRSVAFYKQERSWVIEDEFTGAGEHDFETRFHLAPGLLVTLEKKSVVVRDPESGLGIRISSIELDDSPLLESQPVSRDYGEMSDSISVCWQYQGLPKKFTWHIDLVEVHIPMSDML